MEQTSMALAEQRQKQRSEAFTVVVPAAESEMPRGYPTFQGGEAVMGVPVGAIRQ